MSTFLNLSRLGLRILSTFFAALTLGLIATNLKTYNDTKGRNLIYAGFLVWTNKKEVDAKAAEVLLGGAVGCLVLAGGLLLAGFVIPRVSRNPHRLKQYTILTSKGHSYGKLEFLATSRLGL